jgi:hypothetical protein
MSGTVYGGQVTCNATPRFAKENPIPFTPKKLFNTKGQYIYHLVSCQCE